MTTGGFFKTHVFKQHSKRRWDLYKAEWIASSYNILHKTKFRPEYYTLQCYLAKKVYTLSTGPCKHLWFATRLICCKWSTGREGEGRMFSNEKEVIQLLLQIFFFKEGRIKAMPKSVASLRQHQPSAVALVALALCVGGGGELGLGHCSRLVSMWEIWAALVCRRPTISPLSRSSSSHSLTNLVFFQH